MIDARRTISAAFNLQIDRQWRVPKTHGLAILPRSPRMAHRRKSWPTTTLCARVRGVGARVIIDGRPLGKGGLTDKRDSTCQNLQCKHRIDSVLMRAQRVPESVARGGLLIWQAADYGSLEFVSATVWSERDGFKRRTDMSTN
jgi:hypothetical protein